MRIPFLSPPTDGEETPLWRHPEVGLIDWLIQLSFPLLLPLERMTTAALSGDLSLLLELRGKMDQRDGVQHDSVLSEWRLTLLQMSRADGSTLEARLYHPPGSGDTLLPVVLWFHGGGYTLSTARDSHGATFAAELAAMVAEAPKVAWLSVEYRLAPEHPFPAAPLDGATALEYICDASRAASIGLDSSAIHVAGASAGAGVAAAVATDAARRGVAVRSLFLDEPCLDPRANSASFAVNSATTIAPVAWLRWSWSVYYPFEHADAVSDRFFVLPRLAEPDVLGSPAHPTTLVITASADPLRAEGAAYAEALRAAGKLEAHIEAKGSHVISLTLDKEARRRALTAWAALLHRGAGREGSGPRE